MSEWIRKINWKYVVVMLIGNVILGLGIAIFKLSGLGNDPFSGMVMALAECVGIEYARFLILLNLGFFVIEIIWGRKLIGLGTTTLAIGQCLRAASYHRSVLYKHRSHFLTFVHLYPSPPSQY